LVGADGVLISSRDHINGIAHRRGFSCSWIQLAPVGQSNIEDFFLVVVTLKPHLDHLKAIKIGALRILHAPDDKAWRRYIARRRTKFCPHGNTLAVGLIKPICTGHYVCRIIPASKEAYAH